MARKDPEFVTIRINAANDNEPREVFVGGAATGDVLIKRGQNVRVSRDVCERLDQAVRLVPVIEDESRPEQVTLVEQQRYPYSMVSVG
jgi:hypothetical protein